MVQPFPGAPFLFNKADRMGKKLPFPEFVLLIALLFSLIAFGTDAMLPAFGEIATDLNTPNVNRVQLIVATFFLGTGVGQLVSGPLSDAIGRKPVLLGGIGIFIAASIWASFTNSLEVLLVARFVQGLGISAPRTVGMALVRDIYAGAADGACCVAGHDDVCAGASCGATDWARDHVGLWLARDFLVVCGAEWCCWPVAVAAAGGKRWHQSIASHFDWRF